MVTLTRVTVPPRLLPEPVVVQLLPAVAEHVHVLTATPAGKVSVTGALVTPSGPLLWTVTV